VEKQDEFTLVCKGEITAMKIQTLKIHNFRSIKDVTINLDDYSLLIGENNVGKTNIITALRLFYEDEGIKYNESTDFPKFQTEDNESWIEIEFFTTNDEQQSLKEEYRSNDNILKVRKYFKSDIKVE
jgi:putative ATP-dependent endonuclease of the OLD family